MNPTLKLFGLRIFIVSFRESMYICSLQNDIFLPDKTRNDLRRQTSIFCQSIRLQPAGIGAFKHRTENKSGIYAFEKEEIRLSNEFEDEFKANQKAWSWLEEMPAYYRKHATYWIMEAKQRKTRKSRLEELIRDSGGSKIKLI